MPDYNQFEIIEDDRSVSFIPVCQWNERHFYFDSNELLCR